jgi:hypothetical protein
MKKNEKVMSFESRKVQIEEKRKTCFVSMKVFSSTLIGFSSFLVLKQTLGQ